MAEVAVTDEQRRAYAKALAKAEAAWPGAMHVLLLGEPLPAEVTAVAEVLGLDPEALGWHVEAEHGHEPHDEGYEADVWRAAECTDPEHLLESAAWGRKRAREPVKPPARQVRVQRRRERRRGR
jgi:hypothetical protein